LFDLACIYLVNQNKNNFYTSIYIFIW
jgi:hypothetical protein